METNGTTTAKRTTTAERKAQALARRIGGFTFQQIADELKITRQAAHALVVSALKELNEKTMESAAELKRLEMERLDTMRSAVWGGVLKGDLQSIDRALKISARLAALAGIDAPTKTDVTSGGEKITEITVNWTLPKAANESSNKSTDPA
jgi:hypothetical protein